MLLARLHFAHPFRFPTVNCCAELRGILDSGPDGGACPPVGPCREFEGNCADIMEQFADVPVLPDFPNGMSEYFCTQFPHEEQSFDSFITTIRPFFSNG